MHTIPNTDSGVYTPFVQIINQEALFRFAFDDCYGPAVDPSDELDYWFEASLSCLAYWLHEEAKKVHPATEEQEAALMATYDRRRAAIVATYEAECLALNDGTDAPEFGRKKFPSNCLNIDGPIGNICRWINATAPVPQPMLALGATLVMLSAVFGRRYQSPPFGTFTNLLGIGLLRTGGGKDHARKQGKKLLYAAGCERLLMGDEVTSGSSIRTALERHPSLVGFYDEFGRELQDLKAKNAATQSKSTLTTIMKLYADSGSISLGKEYTDQKVRPRQDVHNPSLSIWGTTTQETFFSALASSDVASGFLNRWIVIEGDRMATMRELDFDGYADSAPPVELVEWLRAAATFVPADAGNLASVQVSGVAPDEFMKVRIVDERAKELLRVISSDQDQALARAVGRASDLWARYFENTVKVASIRAIADDYAEPCITLQHVEWARDLVRWSIENMIFAVEANVADSEAERQVQKVLNFIRKSGTDWVSRQDIARGVRDIDARRRNDILHDLATVQRVIECAQDTSTPRPTLKYRYVG